MFLFSVHKIYMREANKDLHGIHFRFVLKEIKNKKKQLQEDLNSVDQKFLYPPSLRKNCAKLC